MKGTLALCAASLLSAAVVGAPPAPGFPSVGAFNRHMQVTWSTTPQTNWYEVWSRANSGAPWVKFGEFNAARTGAQFHISTHLLNWEEARYQVKACNPSGCSASSDLFVPSAGAFINGIPIIKPSRTQTGAKFGSAIDISEDGGTLVSVSANETDVPSGRANIVNIYLFNSHDREYWRQEARIFPSITQPNSGAGVVANLSGNGSVLVVGIPSQRASASATSPEVGGAYLFRRLPDGHWREDVRFNPQVAAPISHYGSAAEISEDAKTVMIGYEKNGGTAEVYKLRDDNLYELAAVIPGPGNQTGCNRLRLSGDGQTVARTCSRPPFYRALQVFRAPSFALDFEDNIFLTDMAEPADFVIDYQGRTFAWSVVGSGQYGRQFVSYRQYVNGAVTRNQLLTPYWNWHDNSIAQTEFGGRIALSRDGGYVAVRDVRDTGAGIGPLRFPLARGTKSTGAVFVYEWRNDNLLLRRILKPNYPVPAGGYAEGELAFANNGKTLAASQPGDDSPAIYPYHWYTTDPRKPDAGAVTVY